MPTLPKTSSALRELESRSASVCPGRRTSPFVKASVCWLWYERFPGNGPHHSRFNHVGHETQVGIGAHA